MLHLETSSLESARLCLQGIPARTCETLSKLLEGPEVLQQTLPIKYPFEKHKAQHADTDNHAAKPSTLSPEALNPKSLNP